MMETDKELQAANEKILQLETEISEWKNKCEMVLQALQESRTQTKEVEARLELLNKKYQAALLKPINEPYDPTKNEKITDNEN